MFKNIGPGILVAAAFVGPGTLTVCTLAGVQFGYSLLWAVLISVLATMILQEMASRIGVITQNGLADVVKKELKTPWVKGLVLIVVLSAILVGNAAYEAGNIGGATLGLEQLFQSTTLRPFYPAFIGIMAFLLLWFGTYKTLEKVFMALVGIMGVCFVVCAILTKPSILEILKGTFVPRLSSGSLLTVIALVGTTVVPYNLFLHASLVKEKWNSASELKSARKDTVISIGVGGLVSMAILITAASAQIHEVSSAADMAKGLEPLFGKGATYFMAIGLLAAGVTSAITAPLAAAFVASSCFGWKGGMKDMRFKLVWALVLFFGVFFLSFNIKPIEVIQFAQVANGILLPVITLILLWMVNKSSVMGHFKNTNVQNILGFAILIFTLFLGAKSIVKVIGLL
ncbi:MULTISPECIES: Nramp family divalent metal transporter [Flavobacteriaceae]|uniref:Nramp family divalent metal transporter n=1 Tax=Flavobacteriaceae TaxID=49546 RepID=UPI001490BD8A|nr:MULTISPECIES: Nramp family divalent metal transporter [Allomuricauda]MDC6364813.1 Nramp family divalent metal transporter [Muricauda sp. AC10]